MWKKHRLEISTLITVIVGFLALMGVVAYSLINAMSSYTVDYATAITEEVRGRINEELNETILVGRTVASDPYLVELVGREEEYSDEEFVALVSRYFTLMEESLQDFHFVLVTEESRLYITEEGLYKVMDETANEHDLWYSELLSVDEEYNVNIDTDEVNDYALTAFANYKMRDGEGELLGCLAAGMKLPQLQEILAEYEADYDISVALVDADGVVQVATDDSLIGTQTLSVELTEGETSMLLKGMGAYEVTTPLAEVNWWIVVQDENGSAMSIFLETLRNATSILLLLLIVLIIVTMVGVHRNSKLLEKEATNDGIGYLSAIYVSMHMIDLEKDTIEILKTNDYIEKRKGGDDLPASEQIRNAMREISIEGHRDNSVKFVDLSTLPERMLGKKSIYFEFEGKISGWCRARFITVEENAKGLPTKVLYAVEPIDVQKRREEQLRHLSETDLLTGIRNRGSGEATVRNLMYKGVHGMFCVLDADHFKQVNDNFGHSVGDEVIKSVAKCLEMAFRGNDVVFRLGGDEFAVYAPSVMDEKTGREILGRFLHYIDGIVIPEMGETGVCVSIGATIYREDEMMDFDEIYKRADSAAYESKKTEGSTVTFA